MKTDSFRSRHARQMIIDAYLDLLEQFPNESISVDRICNHIHCSRKTFYKYFESKFILHEQTVNKVVSYILNDPQKQSMLEEDSLQESYYNSQLSYHSQASESDFDLIQSSFLRSKLHAREFRIFFNRNDSLFTEYLEQIFASVLDGYAPEKDNDVPKPILQSVLGTAGVECLRYNVFHISAPPHVATNYFINSLPECLRDWLNV